MRRRRRRPMRRMRRRKTQWRRGGQEAVAARHEQTGKDEDEEDGKEEEDQSELRIHQRWRNTPSRPTLPLHKSLQAFFHSQKRPLERRTPRGPGIHDGTALCQMPPPVSAIVA